MLESGSMNFLFLRGLTRDRRHWWKFPEIFKSVNPGASLYFLDFPGVGTQNHRESPSTIQGIRADLQRQMRAKIDSGEWPKEGWNLFAVSLGGMVGMDWISNEPGLFKKAVIANSSAGSHSTFPERFRVQNIPRILKALAVFKPEVSESIILSLTSNFEEKNKDYLENAIRFRYESPLTRRTFFAQALAGVRYRLPNSIQTPLLILGSEKDRLVSVECSKKIADALRVPIVLNPTAGHDLSLDDPKWLSTEIKKFSES